MSAPSERALKRAWDFCENEHGLGVVCEDCGPLADAFDRFRAEGYRAGIEAAAKVVDRSDQEWHEVEQATGRQMLSACAAAIRALAEKLP